MNKITTHTAIFAAVYGLGLCIVYGVSLYIVQAKVTELAIARETVAEQILKESAYNTLLELLEDTTADRTELASRFLTERDTVTFINQAEAEAARRGLQLETTNLSISEGQDDTFDTLLVGFSFSGSEQMVRQYVMLLETLPYHHHISDMQLVSQTGLANWRGTITLQFTLIP